jgi:hypothetical protein
MSEISIDYHDSYLIGINTDIKNSAIEIICTDGKNSSALRFLGVKRSEFNSFTIGNIILDIEVISGKSMTNRVANHPSFVNLLGVPKESPYFSNILKGIRENALKYISISTSYGCYGDLICESIEEIPPDEWSPWENAESLKQ